jgi:hypothetical protein
VSAAQSASGAEDYWRQHYAGQFHFGRGTEDILAALMQVPPVTSWIDLGSGSESLLWAIGLRAHRLVAVDLDLERLAILQQFAAAEQPRAVHVTALELCGRAEPDAFASRCRSLAAVVRAGCLTSPLPDHPELTAGRHDLVTQFGLLGLCGSSEHFVTTFQELHQLCSPGSWVAGANWVAHDQRGRVELTENLYHAAAEAADVNLLLLKHIPSTDPNFPSVWTYVGQKRRTQP